MSVRLTLDLTLENIGDALCSSLVRYRLDDEGPLPVRISRARIMEMIREEYEYRGMPGVGTWSDELNYQETCDYAEWARGVVLDAFPEMREE
ncbi:hypothetical protein [Rhodococcus qingshengii]|uniref:hypothetical protein n=1 Tax=Rhodococcus qingshengii TaxID=334542 RepID=UPI0035E2A000